MRMLQIRTWLRLLFLPFLVVGLLACNAAVGVPAATPAPTTTLGPTQTSAPTQTPTPVPTPTLIPTATPIPPVRLGIDWPSRVSPMTPLPVAVRWVVPPGLAGSARFSATVVDPEAKVYATFELTEQEGDRYFSPEMLHLPLEPMPGYWWLTVRVDSSLEHIGIPVFSFQAEPVTFRDLTGLLPRGVGLRVPEDFEEVLVQGDLVAGGRVWGYGQGEVGLWWAPGPTQNLLWNNALVMLEATYASDDRYALPSPPVEVVPLMWQGRTAFEFAEMWPDAEGGPGIAWVIQGADYRLYALRARAVGAAEIPAMLLDVAHTFGFPAASD
jgi:hypothetical protein